jgi:hypothetical protein
VRTECLPLLFELGFRNPRRADRDRWEATRPFVFGRWRGRDYDHVEMRWDLYGRPKFWISFLGRRPQPSEEAGGPPTSHIFSGDVWTWRLSLWGERYMAGQTFGPWSSVSRTTQLVNARLREVDQFFLTRRPGPHVGLFIDQRGYILQEGDEFANWAFWASNVQPHEMEEPRLTRRRRRAPRPRPE